MTTKYSYSELVENRQKPMIDLLLENYEHLKKALLDRRVTITEREKQFSLPSNYFQKTESVEQDHPLPLHATFELLTYHEDRIITLDLSLIYKMNGLAQTEFKWIGSSVTAIKSTEFNRVSLFNPNILDLLADFFCTSRNLEAKLSFVKHFNLTA